MLGLGLCPHHRRSRGGTDGPWTRPGNGRLAPSGPWRTSWGNGWAVDAPGDGWLAPSGHRVPAGGTDGRVRGSAGGARRPAASVPPRGTEDGRGDIGVGIGTAAPSAMAGRRGGSSRRHEPRTGQLGPDARAAEEEPRANFCGSPIRHSTTNQHGRWDAHVPDDPFDRPASSALHSCSASHVVRHSAGSVSTPARPCDDPLVGTGIRRHGLAHHDRREVISQIG